MLPPAMRISPSLYSLGVVMLAFGAPVIVPPLST
jgi:hypothetical protein